MPLRNVHRAKQAAAVYGALAGAAWLLTRGSPPAVPAHQSPDKWVYNLLDFGADPTGNSPIAPSVAAVNAVIASTGAESTIWIPSGNYLVDADVQTPSAKIVGDGIQGETTLSIVNDSSVWVYHGLSDLMVSSQSGLAYAVDMSSPTSGDYSVTERCLVNAPLAVAMGGYKEILRNTTITGVLPSSSQTGLVWIGNGPVQDVTISDCTFVRCTATSPTTTAALVTMDSSLGHIDGVTIRAVRQGYGAAASVYDYGLVISGLDGSDHYTVTECDFSGATVAGILDYGGGVHKFIGGNI